MTILLAYTYQTDGIFYAYTLEDKKNVLGVYDISNLKKEESENMYLILETQTELKLCEFRDDAVIRKKNFNLDALVRGLLWLGQPENKEIEVRVLAKRMLVDLEDIIVEATAPQKQEQAEESEN